MIRTLWTAIAGTAALFFLGVPVLYHAAFGDRPTEWYVDMTRRWARAMLRFSGCRVVVEGMEHVHPGQPQVIVANHVSWFDVFAIAAVVEVPYHFVAKKELERVPFFGPAWKAAGHISIDRSDRERAYASLAEAAEKIRRDRSAVIIFPEGTRSRSGRLQPFKKGAFQLAIGSGVPIVPAVVTGSFRIMPPGSWVIRPNTIHVRFLPPVPTEGAVDAQALMDEVHARMVRELVHDRALHP
ncbi:MAG TPA: lysophospholipid acyltransferase family protein [Longimicrobium sp.]